jgi:hypothetical protein
MTLETAVLLILLRHSSVFEADPVPVGADPSSSSSGGSDAESSDLTVAGDTAALAAGTGAWTVSTISPPTT